MNMSMKKTRALLLALPLLLVAGVAAWGQGDGGRRVVSDCAMRQEKNDAVITLAAGAWEAECREGAGCAIRGPEVQGARLQFSRALDADRWQVVVTLPEPADAAEGVELVVDDGEPMRVPYEFLDVRANGRALAVRPEVADIVLDALKKGRTLRWRYTRKGGATRVVAFDIACLGPGGLLKAADRRLATMRAMKRLGK